MTWEDEKSENGGESESDADGRSVSVSVDNLYRHHKHKGRRRSHPCIGNGSDAHHLLPHDSRSKRKHSAIYCEGLAGTNLVEDI